MIDFDGTKKPEGADKVVEMADFRTGKNLSPIRQAEGYWTALRQGPDIPRRTQIDPRGLENLLEFAFVLERIAPGIARFRLAGQHLTSLAGMEVRGMPVTTFFTPRCRDQMGAVLEHLFMAPAVSELTLKSEARRHQPSFEAHMILLPLKSDLGDVSRALGVLVADGTPQSEATRFDISGSTSRLVADMAHSSSPTGGIVAPARRTPEPGFAEPAATPFASQTPYLRLVTSND